MVNLVFRPLLIMHVQDEFFLALKE
jgi:hypothetical protein